MAVNDIKQSLFGIFGKRNQTASHNKIITVVATSFILLTGFFLTSDYFNALSHTEKLTLQRLQGIVNSIAKQIDGDLHLQITANYRTKNALISTTEDKDYLMIHKLLRQHYDAHGLGSPVYTFIKSNAYTKGLEFIATSSEEPYFRHGYTTFPDEAYNTLDRGGSLSLYSDEFGNWLSAFAPIVDGHGNIVAYVQADEQFDHFIAEVRSAILWNAGISLLGFGVIIFIVLHYLKRTLSQEEKSNNQLKSALEQTQQLTVQLEEKEATLRENTEKLQQSNQDLMDFAHIASHDLKAPIRNIQSFAQLIIRRTKGQLDNSTKEQLGFISADAERARKLITGLLRYSTADKNLGEPETFSMEEAAKDAKRNLSSIIEDRNAMIVIEDMPIIQANPTLVTQVFQNLINNGIKYNQALRPTIQVGTGTHPTHGQYYFVRDNGIGIQEDFQKDIFKMFKRLHTRGEYEGSGIGLAFCDRVVNSYGGTMWLESSAGEGATFFFTLPNAKVVNKEEQYIAKLN